MKDKNLKDTKGYNIEPHAKVEAPQYESFILGQGYGSGQKDSEFHEHPSNKQFGDNPLPKSGGGYAKADEVQPTALEREDLHVKAASASKPATR